MITSLNSRKQSARELIECGLQSVDKATISYAVGSTLLKAFRKKREEVEEQETSWL